MRLRLITDSSVPIALNQAVIFLFRLGKVNSRSNPSQRMKALLKPHVIILLNSSTGTAGEIVNEIPVNLLRAMEAFRPLFIPGKEELKTEYFSLSITYIDLTSPPQSFTRLTISALYFKLISFNSSDEDLPNIKIVFILPPP